MNCDDSMPAGALHETQRAEIDADLLDEESEGD